MTDIIGKTYKVRVHELDVPMPTEDAKALLGSAIQDVKGPLGQPRQMLMITPATMALWVETRNALAARDERLAEQDAEIERLKLRMEKLERRLIDQEVDALEDPK